MALPTYHVAHETPSLSATFPNLKGGHYNVTCYSSSILFDCPFQFPFPVLLILYDKHQSPRYPVNNRPGLVRWNLNSSLDSLVPDRWSLNSRLFRPASLNGPHRYFHWSSSHLSTQPFRIL